MKAHKFEMFDTALYDYQYIQAHLTEMAAKGWRLDKISSFGYWRYHRAEPAPARYEVTYAPSASYYNARPTEQEDALTDLCAEAGWVKVASLAQLHIYCNEDPNATPLETDDLTRIQNLRKAMNKSFVREHLMFMGLFFIQLCLLLYTLFSHPARTISSPLMVGNFIMISILVILYGVNLLGYLLWIRKAEAAVREGLPCPSSGFYRWFRYVLRLFVACYLAILFASAELPLAGGALVTGMLVFILTRGMMDFCKKQGASKAVVIAVPFVVSFVFMMIAMPILTISLDSLSRSQEPPHPESIPLMIQDLRDPGEVHLECVILEDQSSILASYGRYYQDTTAQDSDLRLSYTIVDVKCPLVFEQCCADVEEEFGRSAAMLAGNGIVVNLGELWGAEYAVRAASELGDRWFIVWDDRIVNLRAGWMLNEAEIQAAAAILKP